VNNKKTVKIISFIVILLIVLQGLRMAIEQTIFIFIERNSFTDDVATMFAMIAITVAFVLIAKKKQEHLSVFPHKFGLFYIAETIVFIGLIVSTPLITGDKALQTIIVMIYSSIITPIFEEIVFRGFIWNKLNTVFKKEWITYLVTTLLFAIWHLGYIEGIAFRSPNGLATTMIWKMITGLCFGIVLGGLRLKTKNCYSTILLHGIMNIFGR